MLSARGKWVGKHRHRVLNLANVVGCGWGVKRTAGRATAESGMIVFVRRKMAPDELHPRDMVPLHIDEQCTDVVEVGDIRLLVGTAPVAEDAPRTLRSEPPSGDVDRTARWRPARPGISFGHAAITAGTLGAVVRDKTTGATYMLSNNHVCANSSDGVDGRADAGDAVLQPGAYDGGVVGDDVIGNLERFVPIHPLFKAPSCSWARVTERALNVPLRLIARGYVLRFQRMREEDNVVDCGIVKPVDDVDVSDNIVGIGRVRGVAEAEPGMGVKKSGRTSGVTSGEVVAVGATLNVGLGENTVARFADQIVTTPMGQPGDSGALVLDANNRAVGLLFAGSDEATLCNRIGAVCDALNVEF